MISVLIPYYNAEQFIFECINSVMAAAKLVEVEVETIIVDDGSTIPLESIIDENDYLNLKIITICKNVGITKALNVGIKACSGNLIARHDADDVMVHSRLKTQYELAQANPEVSVFCGNMRQFGEGSFFFCYPSDNKNIARLLTSLGVPKPSG